MSENRVVSSPDRRIELRLEAETVRRCLNIIEAGAQKRQQDGFRTLTYAVGVLNVIFLAYAFGRHIGSFWLVYLCQGLLIFPKRWRIMMRRTPCEATCWLDFCWFYNFLSYAVVFFIAFPQLYTFFGHSLTLSSSPYTSFQWRQRIFATFWGVSCGPLAAAAIGLRNALLFHDIPNMSSFFIHLFPTMVMYSLKWHRDEVVAAWPGIFKLDYLDLLTPYDVVLHAIYGWLLWSVPFCLWMGFVGIKLPKKKVHTTVFHGIMSGGLGEKFGKVFGRSKEETARRMREQDWGVFSDFALYMLIHFTCCTAGTALAAGSLVSQNFHRLCIVSIVGSAAFAGARRYSFYVLKSGSAALQKELKRAEEAIEEAEKKVKQIVKEIYIDLETDEEDYEESDWLSPASAAHRQKSDLMLLGSDNSEKEK